MFLILLGLLVAAAAIHASRLEVRTRQRVAEVFLRWLLAGYCGVPMAAVSLGILVIPDHVAEMLPLGEPGPLAAFFGWAYLGMSVPAVMAVQRRGAFLLGPAVVWAVYLVGATLVHLHGGGHGVGFAGFLHTIATHGLVGVGLGAAVAMGGATDPAA